MVALVVVAQEVLLLDLGRLVRATMVELVELILAVAAVVLPQVAAMVRHMLAVMVEPEPQTQYLVHL